MGQTDIKLKGKPEAPAEKPNGPKVTPIFAKPGKRSRRAVVAVDVFGHVEKAITCVDAEAATHWDTRLWSRLS